MKRVISIIIAVIVLFGCFSFASFSADSLKLTNETYPTEITKGSPFGLYGIISSSNTITSVELSVTDKAASKVVISKKAAPGTKTFDIHAELDKYIVFNSLDTGSYTYKIIASDTINKNVILLQKDFKVVPLPDVSDEGPESKLTKVKWNAIDISYWNTIDSWSTVASKVKAVILRIGYRTTGTHKICPDKLFKEFYAGAASKGLHIGCYFFSAALNVAEAQEEADYVIKTIKENNCKMDMPIYFDMETDDQYALSRDMTTKIVRAFCERIRDNGYYAGVYSSKFFARDEMDATKIRDFTFWIAQYASQCTYTGPYGMWQYSGNGAMDGITGEVDLNYCYYDYPAYIKANGYNGYPKPGITPTYEIKASDGISVDNSAKTISKVSCGLTTEQFKTKYLTSSSNVTISFSNTVSGKIATGTTVIFKNGTNTLDTYTVSVKGDTDGNSDINSSDALVVLNHSIGKTVLSGVKKSAADYNADGSINSSDALCILEYSVKK